MPVPERPPISTARPRSRRCWRGRFRTKGARGGRPSLRPPPESGRRSGRPSAVVAASMSIRPSWPSTIAWAMARPSPEWRPKSSSGPDRMEAVKDRFARFGRTPGPSSSMLIRTSSPTRAAAISTRPPGGEKEIALSTMLLIARASRSGSPMTIAVSTRGRAKAIRASPARAASPSSSSDSISGPRSIGSKRARSSSASRREASAMSTISRSSRRDVVADDVEQLPPQRGILDPVERVDRGAQRGERVLELVGDVGGEGVGSVDPLPQRLGHVGERAGELADLVAARGEARAHRPRAPGRAGPGGRRWASRRNGRTMVRARKRESRIESSDQQRHGADDQRALRCGPSVVKSRALTVAAARRRRPAPRRR